jgi:hypothetical protein
VASTQKDGWLERVLGVAVSARGLRPALAEWQKARKFNTVTRHLNAEKDLTRKIQMCERFLRDYARYKAECAEVEDILADAKKQWGVEEAKKAYAEQVKGQNSDKYNPQNKFGMKHQDMATKDFVLNPKKLKELSEKYGISEAEVIAIRTYTASDYKYINPAVANQEDHPERQKLDKDGKPITWMDAQHRPDPSKAANADERAALEAQLKDYEKGQKRSLREEGSLHAGMVMEAFKKLPRKQGKLFRGARMNARRFASEYVVGTKIPIEAFQSQSVDPTVARRFANGGGDVKLPDDATVSVFVEAEVVDARDIQDLSIYGGIEAEWLLPPGGYLVIEAIEDEKGERAVGNPPATAWKYVKMRQIPAGK